VTVPEVIEEWFGKEGLSGIGTDFALLFLTSVATVRMIGVATKGNRGFGWTG
jgi:hypothetical protein